MATASSKPQVKKGPAGPNQLPQGAATQLNQQLAQVQPPDLAAIAAAEDQEPQADLTDFDDVLFGPTSRPDESITHGANFGPGANFTTRNPETDSEFMARAALDLANAPGASSRVRAFAARIARGE